MPRLVGFARSPPYPRSRSAQDQPPHSEPHGHTNEQIVWMLEGKMEFRLGTEPGGSEHEACSARSPRWSTSADPVARLELARASSPQRIRTRQMSPQRVHSI